MWHEPVLHQEVLEALALKPGAVVVDGTIGGAGHALGILERIGPSGKLIGLDQDEDAIRRSQEKLKSFQAQLILRHTNFKHLETTLHDLKLSAVDAVLLDIGVSSFQLEDETRGFSFRLSGPLDMRMDKRLEVRAADLVNQLSETELADIFHKWGEERRARQYARWIVEARVPQAITTTSQLAELIASHVPAVVRYGRIHPATRIFQALRIAVNQELAALPAGLEQAVRVLKPLGRLAVISFHSLEDRIVKQSFVRWEKEGLIRRCTKKPVRPSEAEVARNSKSRSAKMRVAEKR